MSKRVTRWSLVAVVTVLTVIVAAAQVWSAVTERVSLNSSGLQGDNYSSVPSISADGRFVAFLSLASNLVPGDTNGYRDVFVYDRSTGQTTRVSVSSEGVQGNGESGGSGISADGRLVPFPSRASNLVPGDTNGYSDVFVHDRATGQTEMVSVSSEGVQGNDDSYGNDVSADGRFVPFRSLASNLVPGDTNGYSDVFVHDRATGQTTRVSVSSEGVQSNDDSYSPSISADGRFVAFRSLASNLVPGDTNGYSDVFVYDRSTGQTTRVSVSSEGVQGNDDSQYNTSISADGRFVAFDSNAGNLVPDDTNGHKDVFVHDRATGQTERMSEDSSGLQPYYGNYAPSISADGRFVAFESDVSNLVPGDINDATDIFVRDRVTGQTTRVSVSSEDIQGDDESYSPSISADGRFVAFDSYATNLVPGDTNGYMDVFVHDRGEEVSGNPVISASPMSINLGSVRVGSPSTPKTVTIKNTGVNNLFVYYINMTGTNASDFSQTNDCTTVPAKGSCTVSVTFTPTLPYGKKSAVMSIASNDPKKPTVNVKLSGQAPPPKIAVSPTSANLGSMPIGGTSSPKTITIKNTGTSDLIISSMTMSGLNESEFSQTNDCTTVTKGSSCTALVTFIPLSIGNKNALISFSSNDPKKQVVNVKLKGKGI